MVKLNPDYRRKIVNRSLRFMNTQVDRARHGYPLGLVTTEELISRHPGHWHQAIPELDIARSPPRRFGTQGAEFDLSSEAFPSLGVIVLPEGRVTQPHGWAFTADGFLLRDSTWFGASFPKSAVPRAFSQPRYISGNCLSLASDFTRSNYAHFILDCLPRLSIFFQAGFNFSDIDHIYINRPPSSSAAQIMQSLCIPEEKCIWANDDPNVLAERLFVTSFPGRRRDYPAWSIDFLRTPYMSDGPATRRAYVGRDGVRRAVNEAELLEIARTFGFESHDYRSCPNEPAFFAECQFVVGPHGAGLANLAFCRPGTKVLELIPSDHIQPYYYTLSNAGGLNYSYLIGKSTNSRAPGSWGPSPFDFHVDPVEFRSALISLVDGNDFSPDQST